MHSNLASQTSPVTAKTDQAKPLSTQLSTQASISPQQQEETSTQISKPADTLPSNHSSLSTVKSRVQLSPSHQSTSSSQSSSSTASVKSSTTNKPKSAYKFQDVAVEVELAERSLRTNTINTTKAALYLEQQHQSAPKKNGRPRKPVIDSDVSKSEQVFAQSATANRPTPRKRGRPPKSETVESDASTPSKSNRSTPRKLGRPRKLEIQPVVDSNESKSDQASTQTATSNRSAPRKRGRPRRSEIQPVDDSNESKSEQASSYEKTAISTQSEIQPVVDSDESKSEQVSAHTEISTQSAPRKQGKPRTSEIQPVGDSNESKSDQASTQTAISTQSKIQPVGDSNESKSEQASVQTMIPDRPTPRKRGRPQKSEFVESDESNSEQTYAKKSKLAALSAQTSPVSSASSTKSTRSDKPPKQRQLSNSETQSIESSTSSTRSAGLDSSDDPQIIKPPRLPKRQRQRFSEIKSMELSNVTSLPIGAVSTSQRSLAYAMASNKTAPAQQTETQSDYRTYPSDGSRWLRGRKSQIKSDAALAERLQEELLCEVNSWGSKMKKTFKYKSKNKSSAKRKHSESDNDADESDTLVYRPPPTHKQQTHMSVTSKTIDLTGSSIDVTPVTDDTELKIDDSSVSEVFGESPLKSGNVSETIEMDEDNVDEVTSNEIKSVALPVVHPLPSNIADAAVPSSVIVAEKIHALKFLLEPTHARSDLVPSRVQFNNRAIMEADYLTQAPTMSQEENL